MSDTEARPSAKDTFKPEKRATEALLGGDASRAAALPGKRSVGLCAQPSKRDCMETVMC